MRDVWGRGTPKPRRAPSEEERANRRGDHGFASMCHQLRLDAGLTVDGLAAKVGRSKDEVGQIEVGAKRAPATWPRLISEALDVDYLQVFDVWDREAPGAAYRTTVAEARQILDDAVAAGQQVICPCCARTAKARKRSLNPAMVSFAVWVADSYRGEPLSMDGWAQLHPTLARGGDYAKGVHWGLVESVERSTWRPTIKGIRFAKGQTTVRRTVTIWRNTAIDFSGAKVGVNDILTNEHPRRREGTATTLPGFDER